MVKRLIKLEFVQVPSEHWGDLWLFFEEHPGIQFKHQQPAMPAKKTMAAKRTHGKVAEGTTGKCIVLGALDGARENKSGPLTVPQLTAEIVGMGKAPKSIGNILHKLTGDRLVRRSDEGYTITAAGTAHIKNNCVPEQE